MNSRNTVKLVRSFRGIYSYFDYYECDGGNVTTSLLVYPNTFTFTNSLDRSIIVTIMIRIRTPPLHDTYPVDRTRKTTVLSFIMVNFF